MAPNLKRTLWGLGMLGMLAATGGRAQHHFTDCHANTGNQAVVVLPEGPVYPFKAGDEVAAITPSGACAGVIVWTAAPHALTVWGDDFLTDEVDGFRSGDPLQLRFFDGTEERQLQLRHDAAGPLGKGGAYRFRGIYVIDRLAIPGGAQQARAALPTRPALGLNYPNPFNATTRIPFELSETGMTRLTVYNLLGQEVARLVDGVYPAGRHQVVFDARRLGSGFYSYVLEAGDLKMTRQMVRVD
ncbi:MAG: hypothetical protein KatS3mg043_1938 [Rhodothermaceae bacterium]|nr:MAG: hypothetical protein KatS3mg043_1938 [Rhodothermaceae bacterium]